MKLFMKNLVTLAISKLDQTIVNNIVYKKILFIST
jgi:hypothetical protein